MAIWTREPAFTGSLLKWLVWFYRYAFDLGSGNPGERTAVVGPVPSRSGVPDGLAVDDEGYVWSTQWDGACVICYTPEGQIDRVANVTVPRPASCAFGGPDGATLFVTSARTGLSDEQLLEAPLSGSLCAIWSGTTGKPGPYFGAVKTDKRSV